MRSKRFWAVLAVVAALLLAACGGNDDDGETAGTETTEATETEAPTAGSGDEQDPEVDMDAVLRVGWSLAPRNMDPHTANTIGDYPFLSLVYDRLINLAPDESLEPMLATEWEFVDDGAALELQLREDVQFHDGEPFNAEAVKANLERAKTLETGTLQGILEPVETVTVLDEYRVRLDLMPGVGANLPYAFAERPGMMISPAAMDDPTLDQYGVGTGPYVVKEGTFNAADRATFERAPDDYWDAPNRQAFAEIEMIAMPDQETRFNALQSGQIDLAPLAAVSTPRAIELGETEEYDNATYDARTYYFTSFNLEDPALQDVRVRQAVAHAIDKDALNEAVFAGVCPPTAQLPLEGDPSYDESLEDAYEYDPDEARRLLQEAGAESLDLTGVLITTEPMRSQAVAIQAMLAEVGINWEFAATLSSQEGLPRWSAGDFNLHAYISAGRADPVSMYQESLDRNLPGGAPDGVQEALDAANDPTLTEGERADAVAELNRLMVEEFAVIYHCHPQESLLGRSNITGLDQSPWLRYGVYDVQNLAMVAE